MQNSPPYICVQTCAYVRLSIGLSVTYVRLSIGLSVTYVDIALTVYVSGPMDAYRIEWKAGWILTGSAVVKMI